MTDHDDHVARRYRELPREEPPPALDAAILAQGRRAVAARPGLLRRWSGPISIAAVLVLAVGVVSRMQVEQPGVETAAPAPQTLPPPPPRPEVTAERAPVAPPLATEEARAPAPLAKRLQRVEKREVPAPAPAAEPAPAPAQTITARTAVPPPPQAFRLDERTMNGQRAKVAADASPAAAAAPAPRTAALAADSAATPEAELERIAKLRAEGRDEEADRALQDFRERRPGFRIPDETWARVRPRQP